MRVVYIRVPLNVFGMLKQVIPAFGFCQGGFDEGVVQGAMPTCRHCKAQVRLDFNNHIGRGDSCLWVPLNSKSKYL